jgi:hypothetical protein
MNDLTNQEPQAAPVPATPPSSPPQAPPPVRAYIPVKVIDGRPHHAPLAPTLQLTAVPRPGDLITIDHAGRHVLYKVDLVTFDPYDLNAHVTLLCSPNHPTPVAQSDPAKLNEFIQAQEQSFQKSEAYSKTIITLGYAGLFGIWAFVKDHLSHRAVLTTALLVGFSLLIYIGWEVWLMIWRTRLHDRFNRAIKDHPANPSKAISDFVEQMRADQIRSTPVWKVILSLTVGPGFLGALILIYNVLAELVGWPQQP